MNDSVNAPISVLEAQTEALLRRVAREQESRTRRIRDEADDQARAIVQRARQEARQRLKQAIEEERREVNRAVADRSAALDTDARRAEQAMLRALIEGAWERLPHGLVARWDDALARAQWCRAACEFAARSLRGHAPVVVELDAEWASEAGGQIAEFLKAQGLGPVETHAVTALGAGLRIRSGGACVDATVGGILASRERVESELLAEFDHAVAAAAAEKSS
jgi:hypothetical protein